MRCTGWASPSIGTVAVSPTELDNGSYSDYLVHLDPGQEMNHPRFGHEGCDSVYQHELEMERLVEDPQIDDMRKQYPHGHPRFAEITLGELKLHNDKNHDYAAGGDPLGNFTRQARFFEMFPGLRLSDPAVLAMVYAMKQIDAFFWLKSNGHTAKVEGAAQRLGDVSVYAKLAIIIDEVKRKCQALVQPNKTDASSNTDSAPSAADVPHGVFIKTGVASP